MPIVPTTNEKPLPLIVLDDESDDRESGEDPTQCEEPDDSSGRIAEPKRVQEAVLIAVKREWSLGASFYGIAAQESSGLRWLLDGLVDPDPKRLGPLAVPAATQDDTSTRQ